MRGRVSFLPGYHCWLLKRWFERSIAIAGLALISPLLLLLAVLVRITSKGAAFLWQERVGQGGRVFRMLKLRSMFEDAEQWTGAVWALEDDPRVTLVGHYLRTLHLDELPQLWNIAWGEMSFIGPRPERPEFVEELSEQIPGYKLRLSVLPGVTGLAQVNLPPDQTHDCVRRKIELDLEYIFTAEPTLDFRIMGCTLLKMLGVSRERATRLCWVFREPCLVLSETPTGVESADEGERLPRDYWTPSDSLAGCNTNLHDMSSLSNDNWLSDASLPARR